MKLRFVVPKIFAVILGMILVCAALFAVVGAVVVKNLPDPIRWGIGAIHEATLTLEDEERILTDEIALLPGVSSVKLVNTDTLTTRIRIVVTDPPPSDHDMGAISDKCSSNVIRRTLDDIQPIACTVVTQQGSELAKFKRLAG